MTAQHHLYIYCPFSVLSNNILVMIQMTACIEFIFVLFILFSSLSFSVFAQITHLLTIQV